MKASLPYKYITSVKNGKQYVVFDYKDSEGKRKRKWVNTELPEKCTKKALKEAVDQIVAEFDEQFRTGAIEKPRKIIKYNIEKFIARKRERKLSDFGRKSGRRKTDFDNISFCHRL